MTRSGRFAVVGAAVVTALLAVYLVVVVSRAITLIGTGRPVGVALGIAFLVFPLLVVALLIREWRLAVDTQRMADALAAVDGLVVDDLPRSPGGRIDSVAAREAFETARTVAEAAPDHWESWFRLAFAYDAAGDRRRARESLRTAARLWHRADYAGTVTPDREDD